MDEDEETIKIVQLVKSNEPLVSFVLLGAPLSISMPISSPRSLFCAVHRFPLSNLDFHFRPQTFHRPHFAFANCSSLRLHSFSYFYCYHVMSSCQLFPMLINFVNFAFCKNRIKSNQFLEFAHNKQKKCICNNKMKTMYKINTDRSTGCGANCCK